MAPRIDRNVTASQTKPAPTARLTEEDFRALGFTDHRPTCWYSCSRVGAGVTLNITISKHTGRIDELVMDENFGQPAYYESMVEPHRTSIREAVDTEVARLNAAGIPVVVDHSAYRFSSRG